MTVVRTVLRSFALVLVAAATARAGAPSPGTELAHGVDVRTDLAGVTPDLYRISQPPFSSFEVVVDEASGDAGLELDLVAEDGTTVLATGSPLGAGTARSLRWANTLAAEVTTQSVRVRATLCSPGCGTDDVYRIRAFETTGRIARFNNTGGQASVLLLQNATSQPLSGQAHFWLGSGAILVSHPFSLGPHGLLKLDTFHIPTFQGYSGSITVTHDGVHGGLAGKTALLEPLNAFSFDAPLVLRPR